VLCVGISHSKPVVTVQRAFRAKFAKEPPTDETIRAWYKQFTGTGCLCKQKSPMLTCVCQELEYRIDVWRVTAVHTSNICQKKTFPVFLWL
jgi:hypothetical protein